MLRDVRLRLLPNVLDCLRWSPDGQLAVSASEDVIILVPKNGNTSGKRSHQFHHARANLRELMVNSMNDEIPPADAEIYSIGDEQGPGYAKQLAWSPLGTSKYRRCILAVLATNHQIRIFEPKDHPWSDWHLKHDLTLDIFDYEGWTSESSDETTSRLRSRTRAISWSPACHLFAARRCGESLIAAANENFEIVFFRVTHDYHSIVGYFTAAEGAGLQVGTGIQATWVNNLTWSLWRRAQEEGKNEAFLAYSFHGRVYMSRVTIGLDVDKKGNPSTNVSVGEETLVGKSMSDVHPVFAIAWADEEFNGLSILAYAVSKYIMIVAINTDGEIVSTREFVNGFVEPITGLCFTPSTNSSGVVLHAIAVNGQSQTVVYSPLSAALCDHNNISTCHTSGDIDQTDAHMPDSYPEDGEEEEALRAMATRWTNAISLRKQDFVNEYELSAANCRVYGIAPSPLGGVIAAACSFHPNDSLEYITASKENTRIVFGTHDGSEGVWKARGFLAGEEIDLSKMPNPIARASEALLLEAETLGDNREGILRDIRKSLDRFKGISWGLGSVSIPSEAVENTLSANILLQPSLNALRYSSCLEIIPDSNNFGLPLVPRENTEIVAHHINSILRAPRDETTARSTLSKRILYSVACIGILGLYNRRLVLEAARDALSWLSSVDETSTDNAGDAERTIDVITELQIVERRIADLDVIERGDDDGSGLATIREKDKLFTSKFEKCTLCKKGMVWEDLQVAECEGNHRFSRCALTFLPIKEPKLTKECTICSRTVLGDAVLEGDKMEMRARGHEGEKTLAEAVLTGLDICVHCGGRYWAKGS
ncbi:transcription factor IIIC subunit delta N-term-domain-containing protein [Morchella snyderi]|nr:transcription factor IIIC subunit delta N-term-domain-containing protein [Morchella snyderi]